MAMEMEMLDGRKEQHHKVEHVKFLDCEKEPDTGMCESFASLVQDRSWLPRLLRSIQYVFISSSLFILPHATCITSVYHTRAISFMRMLIRFMPYQYQVSSINIKKGMWMANFRATDNFPRPHGRYFHLITMIMIMIIKYYWYVLVLVLHVPHCIFNRSCHDPSMVHMKKYWHPWHGHRVRPSNNML